MSWNNTHVYLQIHVDIIHYTSYPVSIERVFYMAFKRGGGGQWEGRGGEGKEGGGEGEGRGGERR